VNLNAAPLTCVTFSQTWRWMSSFLNVAFRDPAAALPKHIPVLPTDGIMPLAKHRPQNFRPLYWLPRAGMKNNLPFLRAAAGDRHCRRTDDEFLTHVPGDRPPD
jgi:hypothetical protein